jgi:hypothetical protein
MAAMSKFRAGDKVAIEARDEFYAYVDGWRGMVAAIGPKEANACHSQVPEGYAAVEVEGARVFLVPFDQLKLAD